MSNYELLPSEQSIFTEIYLPKRPDLQGMLYHILTNGFDGDHVEAYFNDPARKTDILSFLSTSLPMLKGWNSTIINHLKQILQGYSLYEVDGVFKHPSTGKPMRERVQVIRVFLKPDYSNLSNATVFTEKQQNAILSRQVLEWWSVQPDDRSTKEDLQGFQLELFQWVQAAVLFIYGFIIYQLQEELLTKSPSEQEQEI